MKKYIIRDREAGNKIASFDNYDEAAKELENYEAEDERNEEYTPDFYEIIEDNEFTIGEQYDNYCVDCDCITRQRYKGKYADDSEMFICMSCGCENHENAAEK